MNSLNPESVEGVVLDIDGVVRLFGVRRAVAGSREALERLVSAGIPHNFLTNNSSMTPEQHAEDLRGMGLGDIAPERIITCCDVAVRHFRSIREQVRSVLVVGQDMLAPTLEKHEIPLADANQDTWGDDPPSHVILSYFPNLFTEPSPEVLSALDAIKRENAELLAVSDNRSVTKHVNNKPIVHPVTGGLLQFIAHTCNKDAKDVPVFGKPNRAMYELAQENLGIDDPSTIAMVGDSESDVQGGHGIGMQTMLVLTGETRSEDTLTRNRIREQYGSYEYESLRHFVDALLSSHSAAHQAI